MDRSLVYPAASLHMRKCTLKGFDPSNEYVGVVNKL